MTETKASHTRSALKDTAQRNKSLTGFVKCTLCVKFAFSEWNACGREGIYFISHREKWDISQYAAAYYFTFCKRKTFHYMHLCTQKQCLLRKEDRERKTSLSFFCWRGRLFWGRIEKSLWNSAKNNCEKFSKKNLEKVLTFAFFVIKYYTAL